MTNKLKEWNASELFTPKGKKHVGNGAYGTVIICKHKKTPLLALKCVLLTGPDDKIKNVKQMYYNEASILSQLAHDHIIKYFGITEWKNHFGILTEYLAGSNLDSFLKNKRLLDIPWLLRLRISFELTKAIAYLHNFKESVSIIHGDVKPDNIFLTKGLSVILGDFNSANIASTTAKQLYNIRRNTPYYTAPELLKDSNLSPSKATDMYSCGMVFYEILTRKRVYEDASAPPDRILQLIKDLHQRPNPINLKVIKEKLASLDLLIFEEIEIQMEICCRKASDERPNSETVQKALFKWLGNRIRNAELEKHVETTKAKIMFKNFDEKHFTEPLPSIDLFHINHLSENYSPSSSNSNSKILHSYLTKIKRFLKKDKINKAIDELDHLCDVSTTNINADEVADAVGISEIFCAKSYFLKALQMIHFFLSKSFTSVRSESEQINMKKCANVIRKVMQFWFDGGKSSLILQHCLPLLEKINCQIGQTLSETKVLCFLYIGLCYLYNEQPDKAHENFEKAWSHVKVLFEYDEPKRHFLYPLCLQHIAAGNYYMKKNTIALEQYQQVIELYNSVVDLDDQNKQMRITNAEKACQEVRSSQRYFFFSRVFSFKRQRSLV